MGERARSLLGVCFVAFALVLGLFPTAMASATTGTMLVAADTTLAEDHNGQIQVTVDNVTLDCAGHKVTGIGSGNGIELDGATVTVRNCDVSGFRNGILLGDAGGGLVEKNHVHDNGTSEFSIGIGGWGTSNNTIRNNLVERIGDDGIHLSEDSDNNTVAGNTVIENGRFGIGLRYSDTNTISGNEARSNGSAGFSIVDSEYAVVSGNEARNNGIYGFVFGRAWGTTITNNEAWSNGYGGFWFDDSQNSIVLGNSASENTVEGFRSVDSTATFTDNDAHRNGDWGFDVDLTSHNTFKGNSCTGNGFGGSDPSGLCQEERVGLVDTSRGMWYLRHSDLSVLSFYYGNPGDVPFLGDWDCDTQATPGLFRTSDAFAYLRNSNSQWIADIRFFFGNPSDIPLAGDFNGDGCDTLSIYRPSEAQFYIINKLGENEGGLGAAEY